MKVHQADLANISTKDIDSVSSNDHTILYGEVGADSSISRNAAMNPKLPQSNVPFPQIECAAVESVFPAPTHSDLFAAGLEFLEWERKRHRIFQATIHV